MPRLLDGLKDVTEFLDEAFEACKDHSLFDALVQAAPWAADATDALPIVGFLTKQAAKFLTNDPDEQGRIACTLAYQRSVEQAVAALRQELPPVKPRQLTRLVAKEAAPVSLAGFTLDQRGLSHPFVKAADEAVRAFAEAAQWEEGLTNRLIRQIHGAFRSNLAFILAHPRTKERFEHFETWIGLTAEGDGGRHALAQHHQYLLWRFEQQRILGDEPFALANTYTETECHVALWKEVHARQIAGKNSPSDEKPTRVFLVEKTLKLLATSEFHEPIIVRGIAGIGKSSFTLRLATELLKHGFQPLRIELGDVDITAKIEESLPRALRYSHSEMTALHEFDPELTAKDFAELTTGDETIEFCGTTVSPYVLILDGWDEIITGSSRGFRDDVLEMLDSVSRKFFGASHLNRPKIHVIITGRPTRDISDAKKLFREATPILTILPLTPKQLKQAIERFLDAQKSAPRFGATTDAAKPLLETGKPALRDLQWFAPVIDEYSKNFDDAKNLKGDLEGTAAVLGLPLLLQLTLRVLAPLEGQEHLLKAIQSPTTLFRTLIDVTHEHGARPASAALSPGNRHRLTGEVLRPILGMFATAITSVEAEEISRAELKLRLNWDRIAELCAADDLSDDERQDDFISKVIIAFFFTEGQRQGCRFVHKSFREFLFAEAIVQQLKEYGRNPKVAEAYQHRHLGLEERSVYWKDFAEDDPRHELTHRLAETWATAWVTSELQTHLDALITWEIERAAGKSPPERRLGKSTEPLTLEQWQFVRDGLADVWDWWAEGVPLRGVPKRNESRVWELAPPEIVKLNRRCSALDSYQWKGKEQDLPRPSRVTTADARLGDAFFLLTAVVHAEVMRYEQVSGKKQVKEERYIRRRYQTAVWNDSAWGVHFCPGGSDGDYFPNFIARINASGWRPLGQFPGSAICRAIDLAGAGASLTNFGGADLRKVNLRDASFFSANLRLAIMANARLQNTNFLRANLSGVDFQDAVLRSADLSDANFERANIGGADLRNTNLTQEQFDSARSDEHTKLPPQIRRWSSN